MSNTLPGHLAPTAALVSAAPTAASTFAPVTTTRTAPASWARAGAAGAGAALVAALFYEALQGELPYHDAARFTEQVTAGQPVWDIGHVLLQPLALLLYKLTGAPAVVVLKQLSSLSAALAIGVFHATLLRLGISRWNCILGTALLACCCSVITLAPSAHPKLALFPFVNAALLCLIEATRPGARRPLLLGAACGVFVAIAAGFHASALTVLPFAALAVLVEARRHGLGVVSALARGALLAIAGGLGFLVLVLALYPILTGAPLTAQGLVGSVAGKADLRTPAVPLVVHAARAVFGTVNDIIAVPGLGATVQAWMRGQVPSLQPYASLLPIFAIWLFSGLVLAAIYLRTAAVVAVQRTFPAPAAFLCGAQLWSAWYGLNDPEHWFQLAGPTIILLLTVFPPRVVRAVLPAWTAATIVLNLALFAIPTATYPLARNEAALARTLTPADLLITFISYPGRPYAGFFTLPNIRTLALDTALGAPGGEQAVNAAIADTLRDGHRVVVADILDPFDWEAPWMLLLSQRITKDRVHALLTQGRTATRLADIGGIKLWALTSAPTGSR